MEDLFEKTISSTTIYIGKILNVRRDEVKLGSERVTLREVVDHISGVAIVAEIENKIIMVKQFRYPAQDILYELPAGMLNSEDENILDAAKRELEEETGYIAQNWESLGYVWSSPGFCNEKIYLFKASNLSYKGQHLDDDEELDTISIDKDRVFDMIKLGVINDAKSIVAISRAYKL